MAVGWVGEAVLAVVAPPSRPGDPDGAAAPSHRQAGSARWVGRPWLAPSASSLSAEGFTMPTRVSRPPSCADVPRFVELSRPRAAQPVSAASKHAAPMRRRARFVDGRRSRLAAGRTRRAGAGVPAASGSRSWCRRRGGRARRWRPPREWSPGRRQAAPRSAPAAPRWAAQVGVVPGPTAVADRTKVRSRKRLTARPGC
jgi:hypothetical protein